MDPGAWWATVHRVKRVGAVQYSSVAQSCPTLCDPMDCSSPGFLVLYHLPELPQTQALRVSIAIQLTHSLSSSSPPAFNISQHQGVFQRLSSSHQVDKYLSFSFSISPYDAYSGLISFRIDQFYFPAVQGTLKNLLQHHSSKVSVLQCPSFFMVQLSFP